jgi:CubicO group peptidase (beta-lactamase class C family)
LRARAFLGAQLSSRARSEAEFLSEVRSYDLAFAPGSRFQYSNPGYTLLAIVIERVAGRTWADALRDRVFVPAEMADSGFMSDANGVATGHLPFRCGLLFGGICELRLPRWNYSLIRGAGAVYSSVTDLYQWDRALARMERERPSLWSCYGRPDRERYAAGWEIEDTELAGGQRVRWMQHSGEDPGFAGFFLRAPEIGLALIVLSNTDFYAAASERYDIHAELRKLLLGKPYMVVHD